MELVDIRKTEPGKAEITIGIGGTTKIYDFSYVDKEIFAVQFPEELERMLRLLPVSVMQSIVKKIKKVLTAKDTTLPYSIELEKEILALV